MKKSVYTLSFALIMLLSSCGKDDGPIITHEMGTWELDSYIMINVPQGFQQKNEGTIFNIDEVSFGGVVIESYELTLNSNKTYSRTLGVTGPDIKDNGTWVLEDDELTLTSEDDEGDAELQIEENDNDQLWWSVPSQFLLLHDTVTSDYFNSLDDTGKNDLFTAVSIDLVYAFERK